jgi:hypothetical protein
VSELDGEEDGEEEADDSFCAVRGVCVLVLDESLRRVRLGCVGDLKMRCVERPRADGAGRGEESEDQEED